MMNPLSEALRAWSGLVSSGYEVPAASIPMNQAAEVIETMQEALEAILDRPERDLKWAGMTPKDIALVTLREMRVSGYA